MENSINQIKLINIKDTQAVWINNIISSFFKVFFIVFLGFYLLISIALIRQIKLMSKTVVSPINKYLVVIGYLHLIFVVMILLFTIFAL